MRSNLSQRRLWKRTTIAIASFWPAPNDARTPFDVSSCAWRNCGGLSVLPPPYNAHGAGGKLAVDHALPAESGLEGIVSKLCAPGNGRKPDYRRMPVLHDRPVHGSQPGKRSKPSSKQWLEG